MTTPKQKKKSGKRRKRILGWGTPKKLQMEMIKKVRNKIQREELE